VNGVLGGQSKSMNWDAAGALGEIIGATAVVVSVIYLAVQIRSARADSASAATASVVEGFSRWRSTILQNTDVAEALTKANRQEALTERELLQVRMVFDELLVLSIIGPGEVEGRGTGHSPAILEYLKMMFEENPGLIPYWQRYRRVAMRLSEDSVSAIDEIIATLGDEVQLPPKTSLESDA
jgi:hypothetical protein